MKRYIVNGWNNFDITDRLEKFGEVIKISDIFNNYLLITNSELGDILDIGLVADARLEDDCYLNKKCLYCDDRHDFSILENEKLDVYVYNNELNIDVLSAGCYEVKINFCPICGRVL